MDPGAKRVSVSPGLTIAERRIAWANGAGREVGEHSATWGDNRWPVCDAACAIWGHIEERWRTGCRARQHPSGITRLFEGWPREGCNQQAPTEVGYAACDLPNCFAHDVDDVSRRRA